MSKKGQKWYGLVLSIIMLFTLIGCSEATTPAGGGELAIDYVSPDGVVQTETPAEGESSPSWFAQLRERLTADKEQAGQDDPADSGETELPEEAAEEEKTDGRDEEETQEEENTSQKEQNQTNLVQGDMETNTNTSTDEESSPSSTDASEPESSPDEEEQSKDDDKDEDEDEDEEPAPNMIRVTMHIRCDTAVANGMHLEDKWKGIVPASGIILGTTTFELEEGSTAFDLICLARDKYKIHMQYSGTEETAYIEGINNLYEFDGGRWSGWMYSVDGWYPNYGCGVYVLKNGESVEWNYTCDLGRDLEGAGWMAGTL